MCISRKVAVESVVSATACQILLFTQAPSPPHPCLAALSALAWQPYSIGWPLFGQLQQHLPTACPLTPFPWMDYLLLVLFIGSALAAVAAAALARLPSSPPPHPHARAAGDGHICCQ